MKKLSVFIAAILTLSMAFAAGAFASEPAYDFDTMVDWNIAIASPEGTVAVLEENNYYIYPMEEDSIPYVMVTSYTGYADYDEYEFLDEFTDYMKGQYDDLEVVSDAYSVIIDGVEYFETDYDYTVQGYHVSDRRIAKKVENRMYLFSSKEIEELDRTVADLLEQVISNSIYTDDEGNEIALETAIDNEIGVIEWDDEYADQLKEEGYDGEFITFDEVGFEMYMLSDLQPGDLPENQPDPETFLGFYVDDAESAYIGIQFVKSDMNLDEFEKVLNLLGGIEDPERFIVNGVEYVRYFMPENDVLCLTTAIDGKGLLEFSFYPLSDDEFISVAEVLATSIRPVKE